MTNLKSMIRVVSMQQMMSAKKKLESAHKLDRPSTLQLINDRFKTENIKLNFKFQELTDQLIKTKHQATRLYEQARFEEA